MSQRDDDRFRPQPGKEGRRGERFINKVLRKASKAGAKALTTVHTKEGYQPGARLGRGHVAARFAGKGLGPNARRVVIKACLVHLAKAGPRSTSTHLRYIERDGVDRQGGPGCAYGPSIDAADLDAFQARGEGDRHQFRFIVSPEEAAQLDELRTYTRHLMARMEADLCSRLDWVAVDHWNTDNPHTHVVLRGKDDTGKDLIIARDYIAHGMRQRASELATEWLGPRTTLEIRQSLAREVSQNGWTGLDRTLQCAALASQITLAALALPGLQPHRQMLIGRLQHLQHLGLATEVQPGAWALHPETEPTLRALGERGDIIRTLQRAMSGQTRELVVFEGGVSAPPIIGRVAAKGLADELHDKGYLVIDGIDGKAHYLALPPHAELEHFPVGGIVEARCSQGPRPADRTIATLTMDGIYRADHHLAIAISQGITDRDPQDVVAAHVRRLEALRRAGIVERLAEGVWRVPSDLPEQGHRYDAQRRGGVSVALRSQVPIEQQTRAVGATWLDQQLIGDHRRLSDLGFGSDVRQALQLRADLLVEQGIAKRQGPETNRQLLLPHNLLTTLRERDLAQAAKSIATETGLRYRATADGQRISGAYRRNIELSSGRFAMLDSALGFSLVPWRPVLTPRLGQQVSAVLQGDSVSFSWQRTRDIIR